jgi:hypothetical protein
MLKRGIKGSMLLLLKKDGLDLILFKRKKMGIRGSIHILMFTDVKFLKENRTW